MRRGLNALAIRLSDRDIDDLVNHFDHDRNGRIDYTEFIRQFDWLNDSSRPSTLSRGVIDVLKHKFRGSNVNVEAAFRPFDRDGSGTISPHEFRSGLRQLNIRLDYRELNEVINHFDRYLLRPIYMEDLYVEFVCECIYVYVTYILDGAGTGLGGLNTASSLESSGASSQTYGSILTAILHMI